jgi:hypothetical protein
MGETPYHQSADQEPIEMRCHINLPGLQ